MYEVPLHRAPLHTRVLQGIGLSVLLTAFRVSAYRSWRGMPAAVLFDFAITVVIAGAAGGVCYYATDVLPVRGGWRQTVANVVSILVYGFAAIAALFLLLGPRAWESN